MAIVIGQYQQLGGILMCPWIQCKALIKQANFMRLSWYVASALSFRINLKCDSDTCQHRSYGGFRKYEIAVECSRAGCAGTKKVLSPESIFW
jgi:hypothetical protein